jgi:hypothetical protein
MNLQAHSENSQRFLSSGTNAEVTLKTETKHVPLLRLQPESEVVNDLYALGWNSNMIGEYIALINGLTPITSLVVSASARESNCIGPHMEGRGIHVPIEGDTLITPTIVLPQGWSVYLKGGNTAKNTQGSITELSTLEDALLYHDGPNTTHGIVPRIKERQYATTAKEEYISWLSFITKAISVYNIKSWNDCFLLGIPIMLPPLLLQESTSNLQELAKNSTTLDTAQRAAIDAGLGLTVVLFPGDSRLQTRYRDIPDGERIVAHMRDAHDTHLFAHVARLVRNLVRIGKMTDYGSSHSQQVIDANSNLERLPLLPIADFMDVQDISQYTESDKTALLFRRFYGLIGENIDVFDAKIVDKSTRMSGIIVILNELLADTSASEELIDALAVIATVLGTRPVIAVVSGILAIEGTANHDNPATTKQALIRIAKKMSYRKRIPCNVSKLWKEDLHPEHAFDFSQLKSLNVDVIKLIAAAMGAGELLCSSIYLECLEILHTPGDTNPQEEALQVKYNLSVDGDFRK